MAVGGAGDQPAGGVGFLHAPEQVGEAVRRQGEVLAQRSKVTTAVGLDGNDLEDEAGNERLGFLVPMGLAGHARFVEEEGVGKGAGVFRDIEAGHIEPVERIEGGRGQAGDAEGIEDMDRAEGFSGAAGDFGILALGVDADYRAIGRQQVRDDGADALAGARRRLVSRCAGPS